MPAAALDRLHGDLSRGCSTVPAGLSPLPSVASKGIRSNVICPVIVTLAGGG